MGRGSILHSASTYAYVVRPVNTICLAENPTPIRKPNDLADFSNQSAPSGQPMQQVKLVGPTN
jgi:hypothetical protein